MRISHFFIDRPIFAAVVSIVIVILGAVAFTRLPVAQYPEIAPPVINVSGQYPGASAEVVASTVVAPIEEQINGVENMLYVSSNSNGDGRFSIGVTFDLGTNLDIAQVQVQNRVATALPRLPADVRNIGVTVAKASSDLMMVVHMLSPDKSRDRAVHLQLRRARGQGRAHARSGCRLDRGVRQPRLFDAGLARSRPPAIARHDRERRHRGAAGPEHPGRLRHPQSAAGRQARRVPDRGADARPARRSRAVRQYRHQADAERGGAAQGYRTRRAVRPGLFVELLSESRSGGRDRDIPNPGLERARHRPGHPQDDGECVQAVSAGAQIRHRLRSDPVHPAVGRRRHGDDPRGDPAGHSGGRAVPADLARRHHSAGRHPGVAGRHLLPDGDVRLLAEQPVAVRPRARRRHRGRRRHRRGRERRAQHRQWA